jgi:hypothetical protein
MKNTKCSIHIFSASLLFFCKPTVFLLLGIMTSLRRNVCRRTRCWGWQWWKSSSSELMFIVVLMLANGRIGCARAGMTARSSHRNMALKWMAGGGSWAVSGRGGTRVLLAVGAASGNRQRPWRRRRGERRRGASGMTTLREGWGNASVLLAGPTHSRPKSEAKWVHADAFGQHCRFGLPLGRLLYPHGHVRTRIVRLGWPAEDALIDVYGVLYNVQGGWGVDEIWLLVADPMALVGICRQTRFQVTRMA